MPSETRIYDKLHAAERSCEIVVGHAVTLAAEISLKPGGVSGGRNLSLLASRLEQLRQSLGDFAAPRTSNIDAELTDLLIRLWIVCNAEPRAEFLASPKSPSSIDSIISLPKDTVKRGLKTFARSSRAIVRKYLGELEELQQRVAVAHPDDAREREESHQTAPSIPEYPESVNRRLYETLYDRLRCGCLEPATSVVERHSGNLRLRCNWQAVQDHVVFDMILWGKPLSRQQPKSHWQQVRFHIARHNPDRKRVKIGDEDAGTVISPPEAPVAHSSATQPDGEVPDICTLLGTPIGDARIPLVFRNSSLRRLKSEPVDQRITSDPSVSLDTVLEEQPLSSREKLVLAYILARSVWQYYQCVWIMNRWRAASIHFMKEKPLSQPSSAGLNINPIAPYLALEDLGHPGHPAEYDDNVSLVHNYPWVVALGVLLVDICGKGKRWIPEVPANEIVRLNDEHARYWHIVNRDENWPSLDLKNEVRSAYKKVVGCCLDGDTFAKAPTIEDRRAIILKKIVHPLQRLLVDIRWLDEFGEIRTQQPRDEQRPPHQRASMGTLFTLEGVFDASVTKDCGKGPLPDTRTFRRLQTLYRDRFQHMTDDAPVKVAILDTGIDLGHPDFKRSRSKISARGVPSPAPGEPDQLDRIKGRKNFCNDRSDDDDVEDIDGHGTHAAGIILRLAPRAELYIARVCQGDARYGKAAVDPEEDRPKDSQEAKGKPLQPSRVAEAIAWAIEQKVDIINMSFGFDCISLPPELWSLEDSLKKARDAGILVLAAASNWGNHGPVAWPARDKECAICIHSCDDFGKNSSQFTPSSNSKTTNFMVLGENVRSHWPASKGGGERVMSGTSTATPIATAVVALLLAFARQSICEGERRRVGERVRLERLRDLHGMTGLLEKVSHRQTDGYYWIHSSLLWKDCDTQDPRLGMEHAWKVIQDALRK